MPEHPPQQPITFNGSPKPTVGIEVELWLVDRATGALTQSADRVLADLVHPGAQHPKLKHELFLSIIEVITGICNTVSDAGGDLRSSISELHDAATAHDIDLFASGTHPFSRWQDQRVSPGERYTRFLARLGWPVQRLAISGTHVHVGVSSGEAAVAITRSLCEQLPLLLAMSASSPFWNGEDTNLASTRTKIFESLPTSGLPPQLQGWEDFETFMHGLLRARVIESIREVWWDVRPHPDFGTVELRMCDAAPTLSETLAIAAIAQCSVVRAERELAAGRNLPVPRDWVSAENKWLACRHGLSAELLVGDQGDRRPAIELLAELVDDLSDIGAELGCSSELASAMEVCTHGNSSSRQRAVVTGGGTTSDVVAHLLDEFSGPGGFL